MNFFEVSWDTEALDTRLKLGTLVPERLSESSFVRNTDENLQTHINSDKPEYAISSKHVYVKIAFLDIRDFLRQHVFLTIQSTLFQYYVK